MSTSMVFQTPVAKPEITFSELNFLRFPFFSLTTKGIREKEELVYQETFNRGEDRVEIKWRVTSNAKYGFPGPFDRKVHRAVENILSREAFPLPNPLPIGSLCDLARRMGLSDSGKNKRDIKIALSRLVATTIESRGAFFSKGKQQYLDRIFHLYDDVIFLGEKMPDGRSADTNYVFLSRFYLENLNEFYMRYLNYPYWLGLKTEISRRLYEVLGPKFYGVRNKGIPVRFCYSTLCELLPVTPHQKYSLVRQQLGPALDELQESAFIEKVVIEPVSRSKADWYLHFYRGQRVADEEQMKFTPVEPAEYFPRTTGEQMMLDLGAAPAPFPVPKLPAGLGAMEEPPAPPPQPASRSIPAPIRPKIIDPAAELRKVDQYIREFYQQLHNLQSADFPFTPSKSERLFCRTLYKEYGRPFVQEFVRFGLREARRTRFDIQTFCGLRPYLPAFLGIPKEEAPAEPGAGERPDLHGEYRQWRERAVEAALARTFTAEQWREFVQEEVVRYESLRPENRPNVPDLRAFAEQRVRERLAGNLDLPAFESWRQSKATDTE